MPPGIEEIVRIGTVVSVDEATHRVRVEWNDRGNMVSYDLPVLVPSTCDPQDYALPKEKTDVLCVFLPNGQQQGFVVGSFYTEANPPPIADRKKWLKKFEDGSQIEYDRATKKINIQAAGDVHVVGDVIADGVSLKKHTHPESIGSVTGPPG
ncbi:phage baseplate assembly protein V [uncultured Anaeromusa sp.]|uniref:phage baseplate assembly protein V n=1 Tax=uncultured Anaeromusa sp. TaxID=673273 RepID=UPI0029C7AFE6|nr:phage baseplate assembly protein V [uncultured Anaeromusa sp.]